PVFTITATQDAIYEVSEALTMNLALGSGETDATLGNAQATGTIYDPNISPTDGDETNSVTEDTTLTVVANTGLFLNATDPEGNPLTITGYTIAGISGTQAVGSPVTIPNVGALTINADGSYSFVPVANYTGAIPV
ncbi:cadherin-like domain-containing protein, partial [Polynucleobacter sp. 30F-ANTBAC]|uniref:cadherin-like domain-containing protein n=1 Tax=Polynucleobacter sp. 30F-ANTBAC TaxID=2689095 RepID=UPI001C0AB2A3